MSYRWKRRWWRFECWVFGHQIDSFIEESRGTQGWAIFKRCRRCRTVIQVEPMGV